MSDRAVRISQPGGPEVLTIESVEVGDPGPGEIRIRHAACGLNYIDIYHRSGVYPLPVPTGSAWKAPASSRRWARASPT